MKQILILLSFIFFNQQAYSQFFPVDTARLNTSYNTFISNPDSFNNQKAFFDAFPRTFKEFEATYGYCNAEGYDLGMYFLGPGHITHGLGILDLIPDSTYCDKLIWLSIGGQWDADAPAYLQKIVRITTKNKTDAMFRRLQKMGQGQQVAFWYFYFHDRFATQNCDFDHYEETMQKKYPGVINSMKMAHPAAAGMVWY